MSLMMQQKQARMMNSSALVSSKSSITRRVVRHPRLVVQAGLFNFLSQPTPAKASARANEIVDELLALTRNSDAGKNFSQQKRDQVAELIQELQEYCPRNVLKNKLLFGTYEVLYASNVGSVGGKFREGAGPVVFPGQKPFQILEEPNTLINRLDFKALGFIPGSATQTGTFRALNSDTIEINLTERKLNTGIGGEQTAEIDLFRKVQILYLDERCRVTRGFADPKPDEEPRPVLFVFERVLEETAEEPEAEEAPAKGTKIVPVFGGSGRKPGLATMAERQVRQQLEADAQSSGKPGTKVLAKAASKVAPKAAPARGTGVVKAGRQATASSKAADPRAAAAEKRKAEAEAAKAKQRAAEEKAQREEAARLAKEKAEAEKKAKLERIAAVKEALNKLGAELQEAQVASRAAKVELRDVEKETQATNRKTAEARAQLEAAIARTQSASEELQAALDARNAAQNEARQAQAALKDAEKSYKEQIALALRK